MDDLVKKLRDNPAFREFQNYAMQQMNDLDSLGKIDCSGMSNSQIGETVRARRVARDTILMIFSPFLDFTERKEPSEEDVKNAKMKFGL